MRPIDADDLKDWSEIVPLTDDGGIDINDFDEKLESMPTVDAEPVIRCKDCKYLWHEVAEDLTPYGFYNERHIFLCQKHFDKEMGELREVMIDDFCSWAERKE